MKIDDLKNRTILLFGKPRAFNHDELNYQLHTLHVNIASEYYADVSYIVEGRLITPYEQNELDRLYEEGLKEKFIDIDELEKTLIDNIDDNLLLMSLKLSHDKERLLAYLKNSKISDTLFLKLIKLYDWQGEGFFENDENRDVTAALISRFYENIERNHNVQYATLGLMHLVEQSNDEDLIEAISTLAPIKKSFIDSSLYPIVLAIAKNKSTPTSTLKLLVQKCTTEMKKIIAVKENLDKDVQEMLFAFNDDEVNRALCQNPDLDIELAKRLQDRYADIMAKFIKLDNAFFELFCHKSPTHLAKNKTLTRAMQESLLSLNKQEVIAALASNESIDENLAEEILLLSDDVINFSLFSNEMVKEDDLREAYLHEKNYLSLAGNQKTPVDILRKLSYEGDIEVIKALCKNPSTPIDILYEFRLDQRLTRLVSENKTFTDYIKTENIGWKD